MTETIPVETTPEMVLTFSPILMVPVIAGVVQVFIDTGLPLKFASMTALVLGVAGGVLASLVTGLSPFVGMVQGTVVGLASAGLWLNLSSKVNTNGDHKET